MHVLIQEYSNLNPHGHWFDRSTMQFFKCRLPDYAYLKNDDAYFISSEKGPSDIRAYTIRKFDRNTGDIETVDEFNKLTRTQARRRLAYDILGWKLKDL